MNVINFALVVFYLFMFGAICGGYKPNKFESASMALMSAICFLGYIIR